MCHEYGAIWRRSETKATSKQTKDAETDLMRTFAVRQDAKPEPSSEEKAKEKELVPAK